MTNFLILDNKDSVSLATCICIAMEWDALDEEIRRELDDISLDNSDTSSRNSSPSHQLSYPNEETDVPALFCGYLGVTGGADGVDQVLSEVRDLLHTSPSSSPLHLDSLKGQPVQLAVVEGQDNASSEDVRPAVSPPANVNREMFPGESLRGCDPSVDGCYDDQSSKAADDWGDEQLTEEQHRRESELNALIEESQRKLREREHILLEREREKAAVKIHAYARGYLSRLKYKRLLTLKTKMATVIQAFWRGHRARARRRVAMKAISTVQHSWRQYRHRQKRLKAVLCVQRHWRAYQWTKRVKAATLLQRAWRRQRFLIQLRASHINNQNKSLQTRDNTPDPQSTPQSDEKAVPGEHSPDPQSTPQADEKAVPGEHSPDPQSTPQADEKAVPGEHSPDPQSTPQADEKAVPGEHSPDPQSTPQADEKAVPGEHSSDPQSTPQSDEKAVPGEHPPDPQSTPQADETIPDKQSSDPLSTSQPNKKAVPGNQPPDFTLASPDEEKVPDEHPANTDSPDSSWLLYNTTEHHSSGEMLNAQIQTNMSDETGRKSPLNQVPSKEASSSLHSPNKFTISRRIESALRLVKQSSTPLPAEIDSLRETRSYPLPTTTNRTLSGTKWSQLKVDKNMLASVLAGEKNLVPETKSSPILHRPNAEQYSSERDSPTSTKPHPIQSLSEEQENCSVKLTVKRVANSEQPHKEQQVPTPPLNSKLAQVSDESSLPPPKQTESTAPESHAVSVERERLALEEMREKRQREVELANQSRIRMSRLISEDEIQQVAQQKKTHETYHSELDFAAQPLSPRAWYGLVAERLEKWKKSHRSWTPPTPHIHSTQLSHPRPPHTGTSLTHAQIVAASPKGTPLELVAMVMMYRSRNVPDLSSLKKCPKLSSLSLTKCGLTSLSKLEGCGQLQEVKVQSNSIEHVDLTGLSELCFADLSDNRLAAIHGLQFCTKLLTLDLSENRLARLAGLEGCHHLQKLLVDGNLIINSKGLSNVPLLQWFSCSENHLPRVEGLESCSLLQHLNLAQNNLQQAPLLREHVLLRELQLEGNSLSEMGSLSQAWLPLLQTLSLANNCITELTSLTCMVMLESLDISNNSVYDLPVLLQCVRGCYQLRALVASGNPVSEEPKLRYYITKALPSLETLDEQPLRSKVSVPDVVRSSSVYLLCRRQLSEQDAARQSTVAEQTGGGDGPPSPESVTKALRDKASSCHDYQSLLINHLREHECLEMRDGPPPTAVPRNRRSHQIRAAVKIQAVWRGFKGRRWVEYLRCTYNRAATIIQANYRGYSLRARLRKVLENARYTDEGCASRDGGGGVESEEGMDFEEEIVVDYLDESALDRELTPLSPREPLPKARYRGSSLRFQGQLQIETAQPEEKPMVPLYSLPGCVETEVTFDEWRQLQKTNRAEPVGEIMKDSLGEPLLSEDGERVKGNPLAAWGSSTDMDERSSWSDDKQNKVERITNEWGLQSSSTAELMMKRAQRQKKLQTKAVRRKKLEDPSERLAAFRKKAPPTHILKAQQELHRDQSPAAQSVIPLAGQQDFVYQWVNNPTLMHERDCHHMQRGSSLLPPMEPRILAGQAPQLVSSSGRGKPGRSHNGSSSYPSMKSKFNLETNSNSII